MTAPTPVGAHATLIDDVALACLRREGREVRFEAGQTIVRRGARGRAFHVIEESTQEQLARRLGPGDAEGPRVVATLRERAGGSWHPWLAASTWRWPSSSPSSRGSALPGPAAGGSAPVPRR